jgi:hypothetical protein
VPGWSGFVRASRSASHAAAGSTAAAPRGQTPRTLDAGLAGETYLDALGAAIFAGGSIAAVLHNGLGRCDSAFAVA